MFASFVIITHSYPLSGIPECDLLCKITKRQVFFSDIGVKGFFVISGYLIFQSLERSRSLGHYYSKRLLRLYPGLAAVTLLTVLLAPFVYENDKIPYFANMSVLSFIIKNLSLVMNQLTIDGVFENNPLNSVINGSLWTIRYEFTMYVILGFMFFLRSRLTLIRSIIAALFVLFTAGFLFFGEQLESVQMMLNGKLFFELGIFFFAGSLLSALRFENIRYKPLLLAISSVMIVVSILFDFYPVAKCFLLPVVVLLIGIGSTPIINRIGSTIGDLSYGIYIYAFPVQQTLMYYHDLNYRQLMVLSLFISAILAYCSWHLVEKQALKLKSTLFTKQRPLKPLLSTTTPEIH